MSKIDFSQVITAMDRAAEAEAARIKSLHDECAKRIFAEISLNTQLSLTAAAAAGALSAADMATYGTGLAWIEAMKAAYRDCRDKGGEPVWPDVPMGLADLVERY